MLFTNEGLKKFVCDNCGRAFSRAAHLERHILTVHEGRKDHICIFCGKAFTNQAHLKRHVVTVHEGHNSNNENSMQAS